MTMRPFDDLRVLLVQARNTADMEAQEQVCFVERTRLAPAQLQATNVARVQISPALLDDVDALLIGGSGEYSAMDDTPWMPGLHDLVRRAADRALPTFGSCWGHQVIARALGGEVVYDAERTEIGCHPVELTEAGRRDVLFGAFPARFVVNMGHHDRVTVLPPGAVELARNASQPNQAFRVGALPIFGTQFHSELDAVRVRERLVAYRPFYTEVGTEGELDAIIAGLAETTDVDTLLHDFLVRVVVGGER